SNCEVFIQELGGGRPGGASRHSRMILPEITVLTNIGDAHIGNFGSREKLMENKLGISEGMTDNGVMLLNADDPLLSKATPNCKTITYAKDNKAADYYAENIEELHHQTIFDVVHNGRRTKVLLNVLGAHNILNAVCCFAIGEYLGISAEDIAEGFANFKTSGIRQNLNNVCGVHLYMDCYNASSESMKSSMEVLSKIKASKDAKRIAIIGDITGMGDLAVDVHKDIAATIMNNPADHMIFFGSNIEETYNIISKHGYSCFYTSKRKKLNEHLSEIVKPGDVIMAKGSSKVLLEQTIDTVFGTRFTDERLIDEVEYRRVRTGRISYNVFENYATAVKSSIKLKNINIKKSIAGITVSNISYGIGHRKLQSVHLPDTIRHISARTFMNCTDLKFIKMSKGIKFISDSAFENCISLKHIQLYDGLLHIGNNAFAGCTELKKLYIPPTVVQIEENAFDNCPDLTIYCKEGSYADSYLMSNNIA
ncbi:MAG: leucine-rich repeat protein, partial [Eubacterium sp.]|nr:leucine-rich repeat protein [Eubacterium sp.]